MIVEKETIDAALIEWLNLGFSSDSLKILQNSLYDRIDCRYKGNGDYGIYNGLNVKRDVHIITIGKKAKQQTYYHEIRHCASAEIFRILLDSDNELYDNLDETNVKEKILEAYEISKVPLKNRMLRLFIKALLSKRTKDGLKVLKQVDNYDGNNKLKAIEDNKTLLTNLFYDLFSVGYKSHAESLCQTEKEAIKYNKLKRIALPISVGMTTLYFYGLSIPKNDFVETIYEWAGALSIPLIFTTYLVLRWYGNVGIRNRLKNNIENITDPYEQFINFIRTK